MPSDFLPILVLASMATILAGLVIFISMFIGPRKPTPTKLAPYESGMIPYGQAMRRMPVRFYLVATLFILFDIEVVFLYPWAIIFRQLAWFGLIEMMVFLLILIVGYVYVWKKGALEWD